MSKTLVLGASGFLGSHVSRLLVEQGRDVRILVRSTSNTAATDDLAVERVYGDVLDPGSLEAAMGGVESVFYCVVDTRAWLRDAAPLYRVNVDGLRNAMDVALAEGIRKFVFTSTFGTIGRRDDGPSTEADAFNWWAQAPDYIRCRVQAENLFIEYCQQRGLPGVACCVGNTYGPYDVGPTPHGQMVKSAAEASMPVYWDGGGPCLGIRDAARGMLLAEQNGKIGERYGLAERWLDYDELFAIAAAAAGVKPPARKVPVPVLYVIAAIADLVSRLRRVDSQLSIASLKCSRMLPNIDCTKAREELGWEPEPIEDSVRQAVDYYLGRGV